MGATARACFCPKQATFCPTIQNGTSSFLSLLADPNMAAAAVKSKREVRVTLTSFRFTLRSRRVRIVSGTYLSTAGDDFARVSRPFSFRTNDIKK
jgi:hypothetical protein